MPYPMNNSDDTARHNPNSDQTNSGDSTQNGSIRITDWSWVPRDGKFHVDPLDAMTSVRYLEPWFPPGITESFSAGNTACLGLLPDGSVLKYPHDRDDISAKLGLEIEHTILSTLGLIRE